MEGGGNGDLSIDTLNLNALPQDCIATIISFTSPRDACRLSIVSTIFKLAAESDAVWESFLPSQYQALIPSSLSFSSKKELYLSLCENPVLIEGGRKSFWLEKVSGKKCYMLSPKDLYIEWVNTPTYWRWVSTPEARFEEVPELLSVCWFEIRGKISISRLSPMTLYKAYLVFKVHDVYGFDYYPVNLSVGLVGTDGSMRTAYLDPEHVLTEQQSTLVEDEMLPKARVDGWLEVELVKLSVGVVGTEGSKRAAYLEPERDRIPIDLQPTPNDVQFPKARVDGWLEVEMGEFFNEGCMNAGELEMSALEIEGGNWKGGLIFQGIEIRAIA
ncbi:hypothetical protein V6Z11_A05G436400 [Gossypium hirsutum]